MVYVRVSAGPLPSPAFSSTAGCRDGSGSGAGARDLAIARLLAVATAEASSVKGASLAVVADEEAAAAEEPSSAHAGPTHVTNPRERKRGAGVFGGRAKPTGGAGPARALELLLLMGLHLKKKGSNMNGRRRAAMG